jgi:hypothetical protein
MAFWASKSVAHTALLLELVSIVMLSIRWVANMANALTAQAGSKLELFASAWTNDNNSANVKIRHIEK